MKKKMFIHDEKQYVDALATLRNYFKNPPPFFEPQWREMTYLLAAVCRWEVETKGYKFDIPDYGTEQHDYEKATQTFEQFQKFLAK